MRKLKLQVQMTIDGFVSGTNGEMDWMTFPWTQDIVDYVKKITAPVDTILLGRKLAEGFIPHWKNVASNPEDPEFEGGVVYTNTTKIVFSKTLDKSEWDKTTIAKGDLVEEVNKLKNQEGKDIIVYGGATFVSNLIKHSLIDELHLFVNPAIIGDGLPIFQGVTEKRNFKLENSLHCDCGIIILTYILKKD
ncbi:Dihydrofolate reductase [Pedobacter steynii]|uniref:Dihydrofolate reductase n=1 Tax=Pedobacter steynii TaxID=430522 RepID=A0A1H0JT34_9SPHI|nr:dihydrofolate reductase family protein [Pedobacter steynii]NQX43152.1 dihydrofolate reductase family protein [Pedobacter steynii]SDO46709.1 Dihydrofolate reductase [Pedobacter steynii]